MKKSKWIFIAVPVLLLLLYCYCSGILTRNLRGKLAVSMDMAVAAEHASENRLGCFTAGDNHILGIKTC